MPVVIPAELPVRFSPDVGLLEDDLIDSVRALRDDLLDKGYEPGYLEFPGATTSSGGERPSPPASSARSVRGRREDDPLLGSVTCRFTNTSA
jgi:hypothetical protein